MIQSAPLRYALRGPANPGFDESIGDVLAMAVNTPEHLQCVLNLNIGQEELCNKGKPDYTMTEADVNYLFMQALELVSFEFCEYVTCANQIMAQDLKFLTFTIFDLPASIFAVRICNGLVQRDVDDGIY